MNRSFCFINLFDKFIFIYIRLQIDLQQPEPINLDFKPNINKSEFIEQVNKAKASIHSGDTTQIVLSQKLTSEFNEDPFSFYRHLRSSNLSPYMFYLYFTDYLIIVSSRSDEYTF